MWLYYGLSGEGYHLFLVKECVISDPSERFPAPDWGWVIVFWDPPGGASSKG